MQLEVRTANPAERLRKWCGAGVLAAMATIAAAQSPQHHHAALPQDSSAAQLPADTNIISLRYRCDRAPSATGDDCQITVTKKEFDALVQALDPAMTTTNRQALATEYSRLLIMAAEARQRGIQQQPELQTLVQFATLQLLASQLVREISAKPAVVSDAQVERYFQDHLADYQEIAVSRIVVRSQHQGASAGAAASQAAWALYKRAQSGEDFLKLRNEINGSEVANSAPMRCASLPESHREICKLEPGQISAPMADAQDYSIYRLESKRTLKVEDVRAEIRARLEREQIETEIHRVRTPVALQLDERYFGKLPAPDLAGKHGLHYPDVQSANPPQAIHKH